MDLSRYDASDFDRGVSRQKEMLWMLCKILFFQNPLPWPSALRVKLLRMFGARIGRGVVIRAGVNITFPWRFQAGDHVWIGEEALLLSLAPIHLGSNICISQRAFLCTGSHDRHSATFDLRTAPIRVEDGCWIAAQAFIAPGVTLHRGAVASAGSVVLKDAPAGAVMRGNPAEALPQAKAE